MQTSSACNALTLEDGAMLLAQIAFDAILTSTLSNRLWRAVWHIEGSRQPCICPRKLISGVEAPYLQNCCQVGLAADLVLYGNFAQDRTATTPAAILGA